MTGIARSRRDPQSGARSTNESALCAIAQRSAKRRAFYKRVGVVRDRVL
ncbi:MAG: hypothetical protein SVX43_22805 [Cyanobacteriota bacterium]|nr:hypothetical protein [Cyanobacteriota bacterium]